ncbi:hypothetical protein SPB21_33695 [Leptothoe sp. ISB3NOV94-8A]
MNRLFKLQNALTSKPAKRRPPTPRLKPLTPIPRPEPPRILPPPAPTAFSTYSLAKTIDNWEDLDQITINIPLSIKRRLTRIAKAPWALDQNQEGNCGFAAVIMAMLHLKALDPNSGQSLDADLQAILLELIDAIYTSTELSAAQSQDFKSESKYKSLIATSRYTNQERNGKAIIQNRIEKRLLHHPSIGEVASFAGDYVLLVGLMLFYKDHVKKRNTNLWQQLEKFNQILKNEWPKLHLKDMGILDLTKDGLKKGDFGLTLEGMLALCQYLSIDAVHYTDNTVSATERQKTPLKEKVYNTMHQKFMQESSRGGNGITLFNCYKNNIDKFVRADKADSSAPVSWSNLPWPCIVGVYEESDFYTKQETETNGTEEKFNKEQLKQCIPYNLLRHWLYMPSKDQAWSWGYSVDFNETYESDSIEADILNAVPMEVIALG